MEPVTALTAFKFGYDLVANKKEQQAKEANEAKIKALEAKLAQTEQKVFEQGEEVYFLTEERNALKLENAKLEGFLMGSCGVSLVLAVALVVSLFKRRSEGQRKKADRPLGVTRL